MLLAPWLEAVRTTLILDRYRRRERKRGSRFRRFADAIEVMEDRTLLTVAVIGGETPSAPNAAVGDVDPLSITHDLLPTEQATDTVTLTFDANESPTADIVFIVDESGSMSGEQAWIGGMVTSLDTSLEAAGVTDNRYSLVGYLGEGTLFSMTSEPITVTVYGPDGTQLEQQTLAVETTTGLIEGSFTLPDTGDYTILVDHAGSSSSYTYSFELTNDSPQGESGTLTLDELTEGRIESDTESHSYTYTLAQAETLFFESLTSNTDLRWSLDGPSGAVVTDRDFDAADLKISAAAGNYTLTVDGPAEAIGAYAFRLLNLSGTSITTGTPVDDTLDPATGTAVYELSATTGDRFYFDAQTSGAPSGARWRLVDPSGTVLFDQALADDQDVITAATTGTHYLLIDGDVADTASTRDYDFTVLAPGAVSSTALGLGSPVSSSLITAGERDEYTFTLGSAAVLVLDSRTDDADLTWSLSESTAGLLVADVPFDESDLLLRLEAGSYTLAVDPAGAATGSYAFKLFNISAATELTVDGTTSDDLTPATGTAAYKFTAAAGDKYSFDAISWAGAADARWRLVDPFGNVLFNELITSDVGTLHVHAAGDYTVLLEGAIDDTATNPAYSFKVVDEGSDTSDPAPLALNQVISGTISTSGESDDYTFSVSGTALVALDSLKDRDDMYWSLSDSGGTIVNSRALDASDAAGVSDANAVLSLSTGTYTLTLDADTGITGDYAFALLDLTAAATTITAGSDVSGRLSAAHRTHVYDFSASAGEYFGFQAQEWTGGANGTWRLVDSSGTVLQSGGLDQSTGMFELTAGGTYQLLIEGTLDDVAVARDYTFAVELLDLDSTTEYLTPGTGSIASAGELHAFTYDGMTNERFYVDFTSAATTDHYVSIRNLAGAEVERVYYDSSSQPTTIETFTNAASGEYYVVVGADNGSTGSFSFRLVPVMSGINDTALDVDTAGDFTATGERDVFYFAGQAGQDVTLRIDAWGSASELADASDRLTAVGGTEDGYDGIDEALQHLRFRDAASTHFIIITDEDRDSTSPNLSYNDVLTSLQGIGATLHSIVYLGIDTTNQTENALGLDVDGTAYFVASGGGFTSAASGGASFPRYGTSGSLEYDGNVGTEDDYIDLSFDTGGTDWDLSQLRNGGDPADSFSTAYAFTQAFVNVLTDEITSDQMDLVSSDPNVSFEILSETLTEDDISYEVRFTGDGSQYVFDLQFVRDTGTTEVLGSIPVTLTRHYVRLTEDSDFQTLYEDDFTIPSGQAALQIQFADLQFDTTDTDSINDAFELALLDADGDPLVGTIAHDRDAFFNLTEGEAAALGGGVQYDAASGTVTLDISHLAAGTEVTLAARLVNNDSDNTTTITLEPYFTPLTTSPVSSPSNSTTPAPRATPQTIDFDDLTDVTSALSVGYTRTSFDEASDTLFAGITLTNGGNFPVRGPLLVAVHHIDDPTVSAVGYDGLTPDGRPYYDVTHLLSGGVLNPVAVLSGATLQFHNPEQDRFGYELQVLADLNQPPLFVSDPVLEVVAGKAYQYDALATDPDGDVLTYSVTAGPSGLTIDSSTGAVSWSPTTGDAGAHTVILRATDPLGRFAQQTYVLSVVAGVPNRPPAFTTVPVVDAFVGTQYYYDSDATDPDGDALTYSLASGPTGMSIDASTGAVTWDVTDPSLVGQLVSVSLLVTETGESGAGHEATQDYLIAVHDAVGNHDPLIISDPETTFSLPDLSGNAAVGDVTPTALDLMLLPGEQSDQTVSLSYANENIFTADIVLIVDESASMTDDHDWVSGMVDELNTALVAAGITDNRFALVGFGENSAVFASFPDPFRVSIYGPDDALVASVWTPTEQAASAALAGIELPSTGEYTVVVDNGLYEMSQTAAVDYGFVVEDVQTTVTTDTLGLNSDVEDTLADFSARHDYTFTLSTAKKLYFDTQADNDRIEWTLSDTSGEVVSATALNARDLLLDLAAGDYTLSLMGTELGSQDYAFTLRDLSSATSLVPGTPVTTTLSPASQTDIYQFTVGTAGQHDFKSTSWNGSAAATWRLLDSSGAVVFDELLTTDRTFLDLQADTYTLLIEGAVDDATTDPSYTIDVDTSPGSPLTGVPYTLGDTVSGTAGGDVTQDTYNFTLNQAALVFLDLHSDNYDYGGEDDETGWSLISSSSGTVVNNELLSANKSVISLAADSYSLRIDYNWQPASYIFRLLDLDAGTEITSANFGVTQSGTLSPARATEVYKFEADANDDFDFDNLTWTGGGSNGRWQLVDNAGSTVFDQAIITDQTSVTLTAGGTYYLLLEGSMTDSAGSRSYSFTVDESGGGGGGGGGSSYTLNGTAINLGQIVSGSVGYETDLFNFTLSADSLIYLDVTHNPGDNEEIVWKLEGEAGTYVSQRDVTESNASDYSGTTGLVLDLPAGGYNLSLWDENEEGQSYQFRVVDLGDASLTDVFDLDLDTTINGTLSPSRETHAYKFSAAANQEFDFDSLTSTAHSGARWRLIDPSGTVLFTQSLTADQNGVEVSEAGTYTLLIEGGTEDTSGSRNYSFEVIDQGIQAPPPQPYTMGETVAGNLATTTQADQYTFTLASAGEYYFDALAGDADYIWTLEDDSPATHVSDRSWTASDAGGIADGSVVLDLAAGDYTLTVETGTVTGDYSFRLLDLSSATALNTGAATNGTLDAATTTHVYSFTAAASDRFLWNVSTYDGPSGGHWRLLDPSADVVAGGSLDGAQTAVDLTAGGSYTLLVEGDIADTDDTQDYSVRVDLLTIASTATLALNSPTSGTISTSGTVDEYTYSGTSGERLFLDFLSAAADELTLTLRGADGRVLLEVTAGEDDAATAAALAAVTLDATETYSLIVSHGSGGTGAYSFRVLDVSAQPQLQFDTETSGQLAQTDADNVYRFSGTAGQRLILRLDAWSNVDEFSDAVDRLSLEGATGEDGYLGIDTALNQLHYRDGAMTHFILVTDEDRDILNGNLTSSGILSDLQAADVTLHSVISMEETAADPLGVSGENSTDTAYYADGSGGFTTAARGALSFEGVDSDAPIILSDNLNQYYRDVAFDTGGSVWDLYQLRAGGLVADSFANAFVDLLGSNIETSLEVDLVASDATVDFEILNETLVGNTVSYDIRFTGNGIPHAFDLQFVRENAPGVLLGSLPVSLWTGYTYDVNAIDPDGDPVTYELIGETHGATFDESTGLLQWAPAATGDYTFTARAADDRGGDDLQTWTVTVSSLGAGNNDPVLTSAGPFALDAGRTFAATVTATDSDGDTVMYQLLDDPGAGKPLPTGMTIDPLSGVIAWTPSTAQVGQHTVTLRAVDGNGGIDTTDVVFNVAQPTVIEEHTNLRPEITSTAPTTVQAGFEYRYDVEASDPDGDPLTYELASAPDEMVIDPNTGEIVWTPRYDDVGYSHVVVVVRDGRGGSSTQGYLLQVTGNTGPTFDISTPPSFEGVVGELYTYQAVATDPDTGDVLTYALVDPPAGAGINASSGFLSWTPQTTDTFSIVITVTDLAGNVAALGYDVTVEAPAANSDPEIISVPHTTVQAGQTFSHQLIAVDPDGDPLTYSLISGPMSSNMMTVSSSGLITWNPDSNDINTPGTPHEYTVKVEDGQGGSHQLTFDLDVVSSAINTPPAITSTPTLSVTAGANYAYVFSASDPDMGDTLTWSIITAPTGMDFDDSQDPTQLEWTPGGGDVGTHTVTLRVTDSASNYNEQSFTLAVRAANIAPTLTAATLTAVADRAYLFQFQAGDTDGDPLSFTLDSGPSGAAVSSTGVFSWSPVAADVNDPGTPYQVTVTVSDGNGGSDQLTYDLHVVLDRSNDGPEITSEPELVVTASELYSYNATATDPDGDALVWTLVDGPVGMTLDPITGRLVWGPQEQHVGDHDVTLRVSDAFGAAVDQHFTISVRGANRPPLITSTPPTALLAGGNYVYDVIAVDPDGDSLSYALDSAPTGMAVDSAGQITWTSPTAGVETVTVRVSDDRGGEVTQTFNLVTTDIAVNNPPVVQAIPYQRSLTTTSFSYQVQASDVDNDTLTYALLAGDDSVPSGLSIDSAGLISWSSPVAGAYNLVVSVSDGSETRYTTFDLAVHENQAPTIETLPDVTLTAGRLLGVVVRAEDPDADDYALTFELVNPPTGVTIDEDGYISWQTAIADIGSHTIQVQVSDEEGGVASDSFDVTVTADTTAPTVDLFVSQDPATVGTDLIVRPHVFDDVDDNPVIIITINGTEVPVGDDGTVYVPVNDTTTINIVVDVTDEAGNTTQVTRQITAIDTSDVNAPVVSLITPDDDALLTAPTEVTGTVDDPDDNLTSWTLTAIHLQTGATTQLGSGSSEVTAGTLGTLDTNELINGAYRLEIVATDSGGHTSITHRHVVIDSDLKPGNFSISFVDLQVPVAGLPITLTRSYSSLRVNTSDDFGYGWQLDITNTAVDVISVEDSTPSGYGEYIPFRNGDRVIVTLPDGSTEGFTFLPEPDVVVYGNVVNWKPAFIADPGVSSQLTVKTDGISIRKQGDEYVSAASGSGYHPGLAEFGGTYTLVTRSGVELVLDATTGDLEQIVDRNDNTLYYDEHGIQSSAGRGVVFERDFDGRITRVTDPAGNHIDYAYDENGYLISVTDRVGAVTQFTYHDGTSAPEGYLDEIIDPLGRTAATADYDNDGRVQTITDADGQTLVYGYDLDNGIQTITDQLNNTTTLYFDEDGNVVREEDPLGGIVKRTYDARDNVVSETTVIGLEDSVSSETDDLTVTYLYSPDDDLLRQTTPDGNTTHYSYNSHGQPVIVTDPLGNITENFYDEFGLLQAVIDPLGKTTLSSYEANGNMKFFTDSNNHISEYFYNTFGDLVGITGPSGELSELTYNEVGELTGTSHAWVNPNNQQDVRHITTETEFDENGRETQHTGIDGITLTTTFDDLGRVVATTQIIGLDDNTSSESDDLTTSTIYNIRGLEIQVTYADGTISRTVYDNKGRAEYVTDQYYDGNTVQGTKNIYDALDRIIGIERYSDMLIDIQTTSIGSNSVYNSSGYLLSSEAMAYDNISGRLTGSVSSDGLTTTYEYDLFGRTSAIEITSDSTTRRTEYTYDQYGRQFVVKDAYDRETITVFDQYGRVIETVYHDGSSSTMVYDDGRVSQSTDRFGNTMTYTYDSFGRRATTNSGDGLVTSFEYDSYGRQSAVEVTDGTDTQRTEYEYDEFGRKVLIRDALDRETAFTYDSYGNVVTTTYDDDSNTSATFDNYGRILSETDAMGLTKNYEYDDQGRLTAVILPAVTHPDTAQSVRPRYEYEYDEFGNRTVIRDNVVQIGSTVYYDHDGVSGDDVRETIFAYDDFGNELSRTLPMGEEELFEYDSTTHRLTRHTSFEGVTTDRIYGDFGFLDELRYWAATSDPDVDAADQIVGFDYDALDRKSTTSDSRGDTDFAYDDLGRTTQIDSPEGVLNYEYDSRGRTSRTFVGDPQDPTHDWTYTYDTWGRLETVTTVERNDVVLSTPEVTTYSYDLLGNLERVDQSNGVIAVYEYDDLNRLDVLTHYAPDGTPNDLSNNDKLYEFDYTVRADGRRTAVTETYWDSGTPKVTTIYWTYDNLGRLVTEEYDSHDNNLDYTTDYTYDLVGNRLSKEVDQGSNSTVDETTTYTYDDNDRLLTESLVVGQVDDGTNMETDDRTTTYTYNETQQATKTVKETYSQNNVQAVSYDYNFQGRLSEVVIDSYDSIGDVVKKETTTFEYDENGIRRASTHKIEEDTDSNPATALVTTLDETTDYLVDPMNHTGYAQIIEQITRNASTQAVTDAKVFTLGHDVIDQTTFTPGGAVGSPYTLLYDGHGSTRAILDSAAAVVQRYAYDAYGVAIGFDEAQALTALLYSGEAFDSRIGLQYLRARFYDPNVGRFNRLDPFSGNLDDPQSLHKYLYAHGDPVSNIDPSGEFSVIGMLGSMVGGHFNRASDGQASANGLYTGYRFQRLVRIYQKVLNIINKIEYIKDFAESILDFMTLDWSDFRDLWYKLGDPAAYVKTMPNKLISVPIKFPVVKMLKIQKRVKLLKRFLGKARRFQEFIGEAGTAIVAYYVDFKPTFVQFNSVHGPDQVSYNDRADIWGIFEAKGGKGARLGTTLHNGHQMSGQWIAHGIKKIVAANHGKDATRLKNAMKEEDKMLASVVRVNLDGKAWQVKAGFQIFDPPIGKNMKRWKGFGGK